MNTCIRIASYGYVCVFLALNALPVLLEEQWWPLQLVRELGLWLYLPLPVFAILAACWRRSRPIWLLLPLVAFALEYGWGFWPNGAIPASSEPLRVMTWNLNFLNADVTAIASRIAAEDPDIIALQEVGRSVRQQLPLLLHDRYPFQHIDSAYGLDFADMATFSRLPLAVSPYPPLPRLQQFEVVLSDRIATLYNAHFPVPAIHTRASIPVDYDASERQQSFGQFWQQLVATNTASTIVVGDFNTSERGTNYRQMHQRFRDAFRDRGWGFGLTYPTMPQVKGLPWDPIVRIDYIFHGPDFSAISTHTGEDSSSDHRYLVADLHHRSLPQQIPQAARDRQTALGPGQTEPAVEPIVVPGR